MIGHTGQILDLKWNPFNDNIIASASDDCSVSNKHRGRFLSVALHLKMIFECLLIHSFSTKKFFCSLKIRIWEIPTEGLTSNLNESIVELQGHMRKVLQVEWHPTASNVLISIGFDQSVSEIKIFEHKKKLLID